MVILKCEYLGNRINSNALLLKNSPRPFARTFCIKDIQTLWSGSGDLDLPILANCCSYQPISNF